MGATISRCRRRSAQALLYTYGVLACVLTAAPLGFAPRGWAAPISPVLVTARDFAFEPKDVTVRAGEVSFAVRNEGVIEHNLAIEDGTRKIAEIPVIIPGKTEQLRVVLRAGSYAIVCTLPGHREAGMQGTLRVQP